MIPIYDKPKHRKLIVDLFEPDGITHVAAVDLYLLDIIADQPFRYFFTYAYYLPRFNLIGTKKYNSAITHNWTVNYWFSYLRMQTKGLASEELGICRRAIDYKHCRDLISLNDLNIVIREIDHNTCYYL